MPHESLLNFFRKVGHTTYLVLESYVAFQQKVDFFGEKHHRTTGGIYIPEDDAVFWEMTGNDSYPMTYVGLCILDMFVRSTFLTLLLKAKKFLRRPSVPASTIFIIHATCCHTWTIILKFGTIS